MQRMQGAVLFCWLAIGVCAVPLLAACGEQKGTVEGQVLGMFNTTDQPKILKGATILIAGSKGDQPPATTGDDGKFKISLPYDTYNIAASYQGLKMRQKTMNIDSGTTETAGFVLVAEGMQEPTSPPPPPADPRTYGRSESSVASDPFFWYWMFERPYYYGYSRPGWVSYGSSPTVIVVDRRTDPVVPANNKGYTAYSDPAHPVAGTKAAPVAQTLATGSKGISKPSTGGAISTNKLAPAAPPGNKTAPAAPPPSKPAPAAPPPAKK